MQSTKVENLNCKQEYLKAKKQPLMSGADLPLFKTNIIPVKIFSFFFSFSFLGGRGGVVGNEKAKIIKMFIV